MPRLLAPRYGRLLDDFVPDAVYAHPWEVTIDQGMTALFAASFQDATPTFASRAAAVALGLRDRPVHPLLLLNLGLSFSVHDVSEQAIAHLAYIDVRFPEPAFTGDTVTGSSRVLSVKRVSSGGKGVVHVRTELANQDGAVLCAFERKALVRAGHAVGRPPEAAHVPRSRPLASHGDLARAPSALLRRELALPPRAAGSFPGFWEDFEPGDVYAHEVGRTVSEAEHMQLTTLLRNSHPLHVDERWCQAGSFAKSRVVYGGLVLSWVVALTSRDTAGNALWDLGYDAGAHPSGVLAGDTLYAASRIEAREPIGDGTGSVTLRIVGVKNASPRALIEAGADLFSPELGKTERRVKEKVVEVTRTLLVARRPGSSQRC
jgi:2-methylfumaryl-CoA hydratase